MKHIAAALVSTAIVLQPVSAAADGGDLVGAVIGGIIAGAIMNGGQKAGKQRQGSRGSGISAEQRAENKKIQEALNYFGFNVGTPDGSIGPKSREGISAYQAHMGLPVTGKLEELEKQGLFAYYDQAVKGGAATVQQASTLPDGSRGLLKLYRDQAVMAAAAVAQPQIVPAPQTTTQSSMDTNTAAVEEVAATPTALPTFAAQATTHAMTAYCDNVSSLALAAGGPITLASEASPKDILDQQFCLTRAESVKLSTDMMGKISGMTEAQMVEQCAAFIPFFKSQIVAASTEPMEKVLAGSKEIVTKSGQSPVALESTAKTCVGLGYKTDNPEMVLSSSLLLASIGSLPYAEVVGHHLQLGFGTTQRPDLAGQWFATAVSSVEKGQVPAFAPTQPDRIKLLSFAITGSDTAKPFALPTATEAAD